MAGRPPLPLFERFWSKVAQTDDCWLWTAHRNTDGYGTFRIGGSHALAHRVAYRLAFGDEARALEVCHRCDTPACVRPSHLFLGTRKANAQDAQIKGRTRKGRRQRLETVLHGVDHGMAKLTEDQVREIHRRVATGESQRAVAKDYAISFAMVNRIIVGNAWKHLVAAISPGGPTCGERHANARLTADAVRDMRTRFAAGERIGALAKAFGINHTTVSNIVHRQRWKHVT